MAIDPVYQHHVHMHFIDRIIHHKPLGYLGYPTVGGLWGWSCGNTTATVRRRPLGLAGLAFGWRRQDDACAHAGERRLAPRGLGYPGLLVAFSPIDWPDEAPHAAVGAELIRPTAVQPARAADRQSCVGWPGRLGLQALRLLASDFHVVRHHPAW